MKKIILLTAVISSFAFTSAAKAGCGNNAILGSILGGILGAQAKHNTDIATGFGALIGGSIANNSCEEEQARENNQRVIVYPQPIEPTYYYPSGLQRASYCQVASQVLPDGYGGYYTQWQEICN